MEEEHRSEGALRDTAPEPRYRGSNNMYRGVTISVKALTGAILAGLAALALAIVFLAGTWEPPSVSNVTVNPPAVPRGPRRPAATASWSGVPRTP